MKNAAFTEPPMSFLEDGIPHIQMKLELRSDFPVEKS